MPATSRLSRLALVPALLLTLSALPTLTTAQAPAVPAKSPSKDATAPVASKDVVIASKDTILFDFEGGSYEGWTLEGDCWGKQPATAKTFLDRQGSPLITGIVGSGFLITHYKNPAATGKAVSHDFTIDKPFLTFYIGGGHYPQQACLNLVVDGKVVRTGTGGDSNELRPAYWDVYPLMGKTAHLEVVDSTPNPVRGYVLLDDIHLTETPPVRPQDMLEQRGIHPQFLQYSRFYENDEQRKHGRYLHFGVTEEQFDQMVDVAWVRMCAKRYEPYANIGVDTIAGYVKEVASGVEKQGEKEFTAQLTELGHQWLLAEATCAWASIHIEESKELEELYTQDPKKYVVEMASPAHTLSKYPPSALCSGYMQVVREVARKLGLTCHTLVGWLKKPVGSSGGSHAINVFNFLGNLNIPADTSRRALPNVVLKVGGKVQKGMMLPRRREEWELYHATHYNFSPIPKGLRAYGDPQQSVILMDMDYEAWIRINKQDCLDLWNFVIRR